MVIARMFGSEVRSCFQTVVHLEVNWNQMLHIKPQHQAADQVDFAVLTASVKVTFSGREVQHSTVKEDNAEQHGSRLAESEDVGKPE